MQCNFNNNNKKCDDNANYFFKKRAKTVRALKGL